jgi:ligand-binding SRPBCC domain-containing protein
MVTWRAKHFGIWQNLSTKITKYQRPVFFVDEMIKGAFKSFRHEHHFKSGDIETTMVDIFNYQSPFGLIGRAVDHLILIDYMTRLLQKRNQVIKECAESGSWRAILK